MGASMSRPAVLVAPVGVALASSLPGEEVLKGRGKLLVEEFLCEEGGTGT